MTTRSTSRTVLFMLPAMLTLLLSGLAAEQAAPAYQPVQKYDPKRDAAADIDAAVAEAKRSGRHVLIEVEEAQAQAMEASGAAGATGWTTT